MKTSHIDFRRGLLDLIEKSSIVCDSRNEIKSLSLSSVQREKKKKRNSGRF